MTSPVLVFPSRRVKTHPQSSMRVLEDLRALSDVARGWKNLRDEAEQEIRKLEAERDAILNRLRDLQRAMPTFRSDMRGLLENISEEFLDGSGYTKSFLQGHGWQFAIHRDDLSRVVGGFYKAVMSGTNFIDEYRITKNDGNSTMLVQALATPRVSAQGQLAGYDGWVWQVG